MIKCDRYDSTKYILNLELYTIFACMSLCFISKCCLFCRQDNGGEDKHLRHQLWTSLRHRHGESRYEMCFFSFTNICFINPGEILNAPNDPGSSPFDLQGKKSAFFALFLVSLQLSPPSVVIASSLRVSPHAAVLK